MPRKNLRRVAGRPLIAYAVEAAGESSRLSCFCVTTDDDQIAATAEALGCSVVRRPAELATDEAPVGPVVRHAVLDVEDRLKIAFDTVVLLQPTAPIRTGADVDAVLDILDRHPDADTVISVSPVDDAHPARMYRIDESGSMVAQWPEWEHARRQDLPPLHHRTGALYAARRDMVVNEAVVIGRRCRPYVMSPLWTANIDNERDLAIAEVLINRWKAGRSPGEDAVTPTHVEDAGHYGGGSRGRQ